MATLSSPRQPQPGSLCAGGSEGQPPIGPEVLWVERRFSPGFPRRDLWDSLRAELKSPVRILSFCDSAGCVTLPCCVETVEFYSRAAIPHGGPEHQVVA